MIEVNSVLAIFSEGLLIGLLSSVHCIGMCGGLASAFNIAIPQHLPKLMQVFLSFLFGIGRITQYLFICVLFYVLMNIIHLPFQKYAGDVARTLAGIMLVMMGLYLGQWWQGLKKIESIALPLWNKLSPRIKNLMPIDSSRKAFSLGLFWGILPCGLVFSSAIWASNQASLSHALAGMLGFGMGTLPAVFLSGIATSPVTRYFQRRSLKSAIALMLILFGLWTISSTWVMFFMHHGHHHLH